MPRDREDDELERDDIVADPKKKPNDALLDDSDLEDDGLDNAEARREQREDRGRKPTEDDEDDARLAYDDGDEDDAASTTIGRRARRNRAAKRRQLESQQQIEHLTGTVQTLQQRLEQMSRGQLSLAAGDIDGQIGQLQSNLADIDAALAKAVKDGDDATFARANRLRDEARDRLSGLAYERRRLEAAAQTQTQQADPRQRQATRVPHPNAVRFSQKFIARHDWFDPDDPAHEDSQIVKAIDDALANEGFRPETKQYWVELERRVKARGLGDEGDDVEDQDDGQTYPAASRRPARSGGLPPRAGRGAGGRQASGGFRLDNQMREALDAEGLLEDKGLTPEQQKYKKKLITQWKAGTEAAAAATRR